MNILVVSEFFYPRIKGGELSLWKECNILIKKGYSIYVVTNRLENTKEEEIINDIKIYRPFICGNSPLDRIIFQLKLYMYLKNFLSEHKINVIYNLAYVPTIPTTYIASKYHIPVITSLRSFLGNNWLDSANYLIGSFNYIMEIIIIKFGKHTFIKVPSKNTYNLIKKYNKCKMLIESNTIDVDEIKKIKTETSSLTVRNDIGIDSDELFLLFVGILEPVKNVAGLIKAISHFDKKYKLVVVGEGPERGKIEKLIKELKLSRNVILLGEIPHSSTLSIIASCDTLILPSVSETFSNVVLEALAMDIPVISTKVGEVPEMRSCNLYLIDDLSEINLILNKGITPKNDTRVLEKYSDKNALDIFIKVLENIRMGGDLYQSFK